MSTRARVTSFGQAFVGEVQDKDITFIAATLAYYAFVSLIPLLLLFLIIATTVGGESFSEQMVSVASGSLSPGGQTQLEDAPTNRTGAGALLLVTLLYFGGLVLLLDVVANAVLAGKTGERDIDEPSWADRIGTGRAA